ncbi:MAG: S1/P1 nuclease [Pseudomonadales bacterium]
MCWASHAIAWNSTGHALVVQIAHNNLSAPERQAFVALLKQHPRFERDFLGSMPAAIANGALTDQQQWLFRQAGPWSDKPRHYQWWLRLRYHAPQWHFINHPIGDHGIGVEPAEGVPNVGWWRRLPRDMNAVQAVQAHLVIAQDPAQPAADRALSMTWLYHIVGDLHQPLHTTSLFTNKRFRGGDRGGNEIPIEGQGSIRNLHALWDSLVGASVSDRIQKRQAKQITERFPASTLAAAQSTNANIWVRESVFLSRNLAYDKAILAHVNTHDRTRGKLASLRITEDYMVVAREVAEQRIALAGYRLAAILAKVLSSDSDQSH